FHGHGANAQRFSGSVAGRDGRRTPAAGKNYLCRRRQPSGRRSAQPLRAPRRETASDTVCPLEETAGRTASRSAGWRRLTSDERWLEPVARGLFADYGGVGTISDILLSEIPRSPEESVPRALTLARSTKLRRPETLARRELDRPVISFHSKTYPSETTRVATTVPFGNDGLSHHL